MPDRTLATVLLTDIVNSIDLATSMGDCRWKAVLETHDEITRDQVAQFQGPSLGYVRSSEARHPRGGAIQESIRPLGIDIRAGLHAGEVEVSEGGHSVGVIAATSPPR